jgi:hypothetical protein
VDRPKSRYDNTPNDDLFVFVHPQASDDNVQLTVQQSFQSRSYSMKELDLDTDDVYPERKERSLPDPTTNAFTYIEMQTDQTPNGSLFIGRQYEFTKLSHTYKDFHNETSTVYDLLAERKGFTVHQVKDKTLFQMTTTANVGALGEAWYVMSYSPLFANEADFIRAQNIGIDEYKWLTPTDVRTKGLATIFPYRDTAFVRSLVRQSAKQSLLEHEKSESRFFETMNWNAFVQLESI